MQIQGLNQLVGRSIGKYQIERLIGQGKLGTFYLAHQLEQDHTVMMTVFNLPEGLSAQEREQFTIHFVQEGNILVGLTHPNIIPTYDFGEHSGHPYLVTAFVKEASLGQLLKQQGRFTLQQTLDILKQVAPALDYAHSHAIVHDQLSLSMLINQGQTIQIAGFGLRTIFNAYRDIQNKQLHSSTIGKNEIFLGNPAYMPPERALGMPTDARSDIYALGMILFELLSGANPFKNPLKRPAQSIPSISAICPDIPEALDLVISKALDHDPEKRYRHASDIVVAFEVIVKILETTLTGISSSTQKLVQNPQITLPPTVNWFDEAITSSDKSQAITSSTPTGHISAVTSPSLKLKTVQNGKDALPDAPTEMLSRQYEIPSPTGSNPNSIAGVDPFSWWSATQADASLPRPVSRRASKRSSVGPSQKPRRQNRRRVVSMIATAATTVTIGALVAEGANALNFIRGLHHSPSQVADMPLTKSSSITPTTHPQGSTPTAQVTHQTPTPSSTSTPQPSPKPSVPTQAPTHAPTQAPPSHTGTVIGHTSQATNSATTFTNPADGQGCLLIRLLNGNFVAAERACTHRGVAVNYNSSNQQLVCPAHGAIFDPSNGCSHVSGPGSGPLTAVSIRVNADGTITTG